MVYTSAPLETSCAVLLAYHSSGTCSTTSFLLNYSLYILIDLSTPSTSLRIARREPCVKRWHLLDCPTTGGRGIVENDGKVRKKKVGDIRLDPQVPWTSLQKERIKSSTRPKLPIPGKITTYMYCRLQFTGRGHFLDFFKAGNLGHPTS